MVGVTKAAAAALGFRSLMADLGVQVSARARTDSNVARGIAGRRGVGKLRHIELKYLWLQDVVRDGRVRIGRIPGNVNVADHLTKPKSKADVEPLLRIVGAEFRAEEE